MSFYIIIFIAVVIVHLLCAVKHTTIVKTAVRKKSKYVKSEKSQCEQRC